MSLTLNHQGFVVSVTSACAHMSHHSLHDVDKKYGEMILQLPQTVINFAWTITFMKKEHPISFALVKGKELLISGFGGKPAYFPKHLNIH